MLKQAEVPRKSGGLPVLCLLPLVIHNRYYIYLASLYIAMRNLPCTR
jgi:hypothetical protein